MSTLAEAVLELAPDPAPLPDRSSFLTASFLTACHHASDDVIVVSSDAGPKVSVHSFRNECAWVPRESTTAIIC
jgi:hypothetical protein